MRCPKCGYISFDHLTTCLNCSKDLTDSSSVAHGTTYNAAPPMFLKFSADEEVGEEVEDFEMMPDALDDHLDVVDPDLNILVKDDDGDIDFNPDDMMKKGSPAGLDRDDRITLDDDGEEESDDREIEIDLSQFEDTSAEEEVGDGPQEKFSMDVPGELADLSDLAPPPPEEKIPSARVGKGAEAEMGLDMLDLDMNLDTLDTDFSLTEQAREGAEEGYPGLSLDDIDLSDSSEDDQAAPAPPPPPKAASAAKPQEMDMDAELNFDLDLGGLTLPPKK